MTPIGAIRLRVFKIRPIGLISFDSFADRGMPMDLIADELLEVDFAAVVELLANPRELVRPRLGHLQRKQLHFAAVDHHASSSGLYLSCVSRHSWGSTSERGTKYTG